MTHSVRHGDCREVMAAMDAASVDAIVTDPPYGLAFMGKGWDHAVPGVEFWTEALRVAKPGTHLVAFGGTRTFHRLACAIEDAGWEVRDTLSWLYGSGFPKSHNGPWGGTALKPAWEPIIMARKPLAGTVAANVAAHGTGALNVDGCRVPTTDALGGGAERQTNATQKGNAGWVRPWMDNPDAREDHARRVRENVARAESLGRWPANVLLDEDAAAQLGEPSRFFYVAKASRREREAGLEGMPERRVVHQAQTLNNGSGGLRNGDGLPTPTRNHHPTVKPLALMRWLCRLVTPPGGLVLDPFTGSGTTGCAAALEGFGFVGIEREAEYVAIAERRIAHWQREAA
jgi:DNA modification methylase